MIDVYSTFFWVEYGNSHTEILFYLLFELTSSRSILQRILTDFLHNLQENLKLKSNPVLEGGVTLFYRVAIIFWG